MTELEIVLARVSFLRSAGDAVIGSLARHVVPRTYPKGNLLFYDGESCTALYVVLDGRAKLSLFNDEGREVILTVVRSGGVIGLDGAFARPTYFGTCTTLAESRLGKLERETFLTWLRENPPVLEPLINEFSRRLRRAYEKIGEQALLPVKKRLLSTLVEIARAEGIRGTSGQVSFVRPTHQELAELIGSTRVVVSRLLKELVEDDHAVDAQGNVIRVYVDDLVLDQPAAPERPATI
jgi:CRP-like cAMP-binding protein